MAHDATSRTGDTPVPQGSLVTIHAAPVQAGYSGASCPRSADGPRPQVYDQRRPQAVENEGLELTALAAITADNVQEAETILRDLRHGVFLVRVGICHKNPQLP